MDASEPELFQGGFAGLLGMRALSLSDGEISARVDVRDELKQPAGLVDGGVYAAMAEDMASAATYLAVHEQGRVAMGLSNQTSFLRPVTGGHITGVARARHRGSTTWVWEIEFFDAEERLCALSRMTIAVREAIRDSGS